VTIFPWRVPPLHVPHDFSIDLRVWGSSSKRYIHTQGNTKHNRLKLVLLLSPLALWKSLFLVPFGRPAAPILLLAMDVHLCSNTIFQAKRKYCDETRPVQFLLLCPCIVLEFDPCLCSLSLRVVVGPLRRAIKNKWRIQSCGCMLTQNCSVREPRARSSDGFHLRSGNGKSTVVAWYKLVVQRVFDCYLGTISALLLGFLWQSHACSAKSAKLPFCHWSCLIVYNSSGEITAVTSHSGGVVDNDTSVLTWTMPWRLKEYMFNKEKHNLTFTTRSKQFIRPNNEKQWQRYRHPNLH
jgi:hypothetical protein